jgi:hypothetical protein
MRPRERAREINRDRVLERPPDTGDLFLALARPSDKLVSEAMRGLRLDTTALAQATARARTRLAIVRDDLRRRIQEIANAKDRAIEAQEFEEVALLRDRERDLTRQLQAHEPCLLTPAFLATIIEHSESQIPTAAVAATPASAGRPVQDKPSS